MTEEQLINDCKHGMKSSQFLLVKRYSNMLFSICVRYTRDEAMAKDVLQETLIRIFENIERYQATGSFEGWMKRIAIRRSLQWMEKNCFQYEVDSTAMTGQVAIEPEIFKRLNFEDLKKLISELPIGFRTVFNLNIIEGYTHQEIASLLSISESTSRSQLMRARKMLKKKLAHQKKASRHELGTFR